MNGKVFSVFVLVAIFGFSPALLNSWESRESRESRESYEDYYWRRQPYRPTPHQETPTPTPHQPTTTPHQHKPKPQHGAIIVPKFCTNDIYCEWSHCCLATAFGKICVRKPNSIGLTCGGPHNCLECKKGLQCVPLVSGSVVDNVSVTGTCQSTGKPGSPVGGSDGSATHVHH